MAGGAKGSDEGGAHGAFRTWLAAQSEDPDAALAAALLYADLGAGARDAYLDALEEDALAAGFDARSALGAVLPLLAVELDAVRRERLARWVEPSEMEPSAGFAFVGRDGAERIALVCAPVYLGFVDLLLCRYDDDGIHAAEHEPMVRRSHAVERAALGAVPLVSAPLADAVEDLAHAVVAHRRSGREAPSALVAMARLFTPSLATSAFGGGVP
jgi:hypothetical protein